MYFTQASKVLTFSIVYCPEEDAALSRFKCWWSYLATKVYTDQLLSGDGKCANLLSVANWYLELIRERTASVYRALKIPSKIDLVSWIVKMRSWDFAIDSCVPFWIQRVMNFALCVCVTDLPWGLWTGIWRYYTFVRKAYVKLALSCTSFEAGFFSP